MRELNHSTQVVLESATPAHKYRTRTWRFFTDGSKASRRYHQDQGLGSCERENQVEDQCCSCPSSGSVCRRGGRAKTRVRLGQPFALIMSTWPWYLLVSWLTLDYRGCICNQQHQSVDDDDLNSPIIDRYADLPSRSAKRLIGRVSWAVKQRDWRDQRAIEWGWEVECGWSEG